MKATGIQVDQLPLDEGIQGELPDKAIRQSAEWKNVLDWSHFNDCPDFAG